MSGRAARNIILWVVIGAIIILGVIVLLSALGETKRGEPMIENPGTLIGGVITGLGGLMTLLLPLLLKVEKTQEAVKEQVENSHKKPDGSPINLRDDLDTKPSQDYLDEVVDGLKDHVEEHLSRVTDTLTRAIQSLDRRIEGSASDIRGMRRDIGRANDNIRENTAQIQEVSKTVSGVVKTVNSLDTHLGDKVNDLSDRIDSYHPPQEESHG